MSFVSYSFAILMTLVMVSRVWYRRQRTSTGYLATLLIASLVFYSWHTPGYLLVMFASTLIDFCAGLELGREGLSLPRRRALLTLSMLANLGLLCFFKYTDFAISEVESMLQWFGAEVSLPHLNLILPMGISFYTFQSMSYTIDVCRREIQPLTSFWRFFLYVSVFPQLVAGPIVRASEFLYQLNRPRSLTLRAFCEGGFLIIRGLFLKLVCADNIGRYVDVSWAGFRQSSPDSTRLLVTAVLFGCQIYCDFAAYSSIARGLAYVLGFRFPENFNNPYLASSFSNFWQRWHITLSQWLRDYLYIPLGGNRISPIRTCFNLMVVMVLGGLWHGAAMTFVLWGTLHGSALVVERLLGLHRPDAHRSSLIQFAWFVVVQCVILLTWIVFRSESADQAWQIVRGIFSANFHAVETAAIWPLCCMLPVLVMHGRAWLVERGHLPKCLPAEQAVMAAVMLQAVLLCYSQSTDFLYFQF